MITRIFYGLLMLCLFKVAYTQNTHESNTYYFYSHNVSPAAPSVNDSVYVYFVIEFPQYSARKISGNCNIADTIVYHGCYYNPGFSPSYSYVYDTLSLGKLSVGEHDVFIVARYALNSTDSTCLTTNDTWNDTLHLVINVSEQTGIIATTAAELCVFPNPATTQLIIQTNSAELEEVNIYNTTGSLVMAISVNAKHTILNTEALAPDIYIAEIKTQQGSVRKRWVKM